MPEELNLDDVRIKTVEELSSDEISFLKENEADLTDEDRDAYASVLSPADDGEGEDEDGEADGGEDDGSGTGDEDGDGSNGFVFKTEEEAKEYVEKLVEKKNEQEKQKAIDDAKTPEEKKYVEDNWKPKTWNEGIKTIVEHVRSEIKEDQAKETKAQEDKRKGFEAEWDGIVKDNNLPKRGTEEGKQLLKSVYEVGTKFNQPNFKSAYALYTILPKSHGGGLDVGDQKEKEKMNNQKKRAGSVKGKTPDATKTKSAVPKNYQDMQQKSTSQLIRDAQRALG